MGFIYVPKNTKYTPEMRATGLTVSPKPRFILPLMRDIMLAPFTAFEHLGKLTDSKNVKYPGRHIYIDRGSNVLGVAHLDSVRGANHFWVNDHNILACPTIDDRLGAYILLQALPSIGIYPDILLTEGEEQGLSTAADFEPTEKRWNWCFSFDRTGTDAVFYQYGDGELEKVFKENGVKIGQGSFSDIAYLDHLGVECVNMGCDMTMYHSDQAHANLSTVSAQILKFAEIYHKIKDRRFDYTPRNEWRKRGKRGTQYHSTVNHDYYGHYEGFWQGTTYYQNKKDREVVETLKRKLGLEFDNARKIFNKGIEYWLSDDPAYPAPWTLPEWHDAHVIPEGAVLPREAGRYPNVHHCHQCGEQFLYDDVEWSSYFMHHYCKSCYLQVVDWLGLLPDSWQTEWATRRNAILVEEGADNHASKS